MDFLFVIELRRAKADEKRRHAFLPLAFASQKQKGKKDKRQKDKLIEYTKNRALFQKKRQSRWREKKRYLNKTEITAKAKNKTKKITKSRSCGYAKHSKQTKG